MNGRQKLEAEEKREELFAAAWWSCVVCKWPLGIEGTSQLAHRVAKTKGRLAIYGAEVIHHALNLVPVCSLRCNDACNIGNSGAESAELLARIKRVLNDDEPEPDMREEYRSLRAEYERRRG